MTSPKVSLKTLLRDQVRNLVVLFLMLSLGGGSVIIQVLGWATMVPTRFVDSGSMSQAIEETFSGDFPCEMCRVAEIQRRSENGDPDSGTPIKEKERDKSPLCFSLRQLTRVYLGVDDSYPTPSDTNVMLMQRGSPETPPPDWA